MSHFPINQFLMVPRLGVVGKIVSEYDSESRGFTEFGATDSVNPTDSLSYLMSNHLPTLIGETTQFLIACKYFLQLFLSWCEHTPSQDS
jgi:hypothetical protein